MLFQMKIQPIDEDRTVKIESSKPAAAKSRFKKFFERRKEKESECEIESSSVCLDKLVVSYIEESGEKSSKIRCNCFSGDCDDEIDDDPPAILVEDALDLIKSLVPCENLTERNLLADVSKIVESNKSKIGKGKEDCSKAVADNLKILGYDALICKSKWEKTASIPAGEYEYIEVNINCDRFIVDIDFRAEFEIARSTKLYRSLLQSLPLIYVGRSDRIDQILTLVSEAAKQSLKKKGLHLPPWRKLEYMKSKWLTPCERIMDINSNGAGELSEFEMRAVGSVTEKKTEFVSSWTPPAVRAKSLTTGGKIVTGLSSILTPSPTKF